MKAHVLQHVPFEDIGSMADWLGARDASIGYTRFYQPDAQLPDPTAVDLLIIMGGPMSVNDEDELPWLRDEKRFVEQVIGLGVPVVGVCLGAQLIANALGAQVYPGPHREIGWFDVGGTAPVAGSFHFPARAHLFHWHGETFDLPIGATLLARSAACAHQAFQYGERVIGLQCHPEVTPASVRALVEHCGDELQDAPWVQSAEAVAGVSRGHYESGRALMAQILDYVTR